MTTAQEPSLPATSRDAEDQRLLSGVRGLVQTLIRSSVFLTRSTVSSLTPIIRPRTGLPPQALSWGVLNRVSLGADSTLLLPRIDSRYIGWPLDLVLMGSGSDLLTLVPSGRAIDGVSTPQINAAASVTFDKIGLYILKTDGLNWWMNAPG